MIAPVYKHDCDNCVFLQHFKGYDLYVCQRNGKIDTVIARFGNDGAEYGSGLEFAEAYNNGGFLGRPIPEALSVALELAKSRGYAI